MECIIFPLLHVVIKIIWFLKQGNNQDLPGPVPALSLHPSALEFSITAHDVPRAACPVLLGPPNAQEQTWLCYAGLQMKLWREKNKKGRRVCWAPSVTSSLSDEFCIPIHNVRCIAGTRAQTCAFLKLPQLPAHC